VEYFIEEKLDNGIVHLQFNRPKQLNALCKALLVELDAKLDEYKTDSQIRSLLFTGGEKAFSAGADITEIANIPHSSGYEFSKFGQNILFKLENLGKPSLCAINGYTFGGGCEFAMSATLRFSGPNAKFGQPEIKLALLPGFGGSQRLPRLIGRGRAMDMCITGRTIDAKTAYAWGLVSNLFESHDELMEHSIKTLASFNDFSQTAIALNIQSINNAADLSLTDACNYEALLFGKACDNKDKIEGVQAFLEKRKACYE